MAEHFFYSTEQVEFLRSHIKHMTFGELTKLFNSTYGLNKTSVCIRVRCASFGIRAGRPRVNTGAPVGKERVDAEGYIRVKTSEILSSGKPRWRGKHLLVWESAHGPIPKGDVILFADGDKRNFALDNLVRVRREEMLYLSKYRLRFFDGELTKMAVGIASVGVAIWGKERDLRSAMHVR